MGGTNEVSVEMEREACDASVNKSDSKVAFQSSTMLHFLRNP